MEYTPNEIKTLGVAEILPDAAGEITSPVIVRRLLVLRREVRDGVLYIYTGKLALPLSIACTAKLRFGDQTVTAKEYFAWVIERGDMIDAVLLPSSDGAFPIKSFWIHIEYAETPSSDSFSKKDDGLFAMRAKSGEKAERLVARALHDKFGHSFADNMLSTPGYFTIYYKGKKQRRPDRKCLACALTFEIKKRNRDSHYRVSHSEGRTFASENRMDGWHAFVFEDMKLHFVSNASITQIIKDGYYKPGKDQYDQWAQLDRDLVIEADPPTCPGKK